MGWTEIGRAADALSLVGFVITLVGLWVTFIQARESRKSADQAKVAAQQARDGIRRIDLVSEATFALSAIGIIREHMHDSRWLGLSGKLGDLRQYVVSIKALLPANDGSDRDAFERFSAGLAVLRLKLDTWHGKGAVGTPFAAGGRDHKDFVRLLDGLSDLLIEVRNSIGGKSDGQ